MKKFDVLNQISKAGVVAVVRGKNAEEAIKISDACIKGGVTSIELTYTVPGARRIIEDLVAKYADNKEVLIGAGSVLDPETCKGAIEAGAQFIVAPSFNKEVALMCNRYQVIKGVKGPIPYASLMPSGGVSLDNVADWVKAGAVAVSAGSAIYKGAKTGDFDLVTETAKKFVEEFKKAKASLAK